MSSHDTEVQDVITTVTIDEVHDRSAHSDYVLALTLAAMQKDYTPETSADERYGRPQPCGRANPTLPATSNEECNASCQKVLSGATPGSVT